MSHREATTSHNKRRAVVLREIIARRLSGETVSDESVASEHPDLAPLLSDVALVERARVLSTLASPGSDDEAMPLPNGFVPGYSVLREINRGGQAVVYLGRSLRSSELVAIKLLHRDGKVDAEDGERFEREASTLASLNHPNIVAYLDRGNAADGRGFIVTRFIEGDSLRVDRLAERLSLHERLALFVQVCRAVGAAHAARVVHRDLKPSNIRIDRVGVPHVVDFGLAARLDPAALCDSLTVTGRFVGTFLWASPEQKRAEGKATPASDVYSLGVMLHQLVTGGAFPPQVYASIERADGVEGARNRHPRTRLRPASLHAVVERCLHVDPAARYPDADALADAVAAVRVERTRYRGRWVMGGCALGVAIGLLLAFRHWWTTGWTNRPPFVNGRPSLEYTIDGKPFGNAQDAYIWLPPGEFIMGSPPTELSRQPNETQHRMTVSRGVYMQRCEVSQRAYVEIMGVNPSQFQHDPLSPDRPVERVSYADAQEYCRRLSKRIGKTVRLPTEVEWEYACRAGTSTMWSCGDNSMLLQIYGNLADQSTTDAEIADRMAYDDGCPTTALTNRFGPNPWQLIGMHGNVWEWCQGPYLADPADPTTAVEGYAVLRGGSWWDGAPSARSAHRNPQPVALKTSTAGFRVVVEE